MNNIIYNGKPVPFNFGKIRRRGIKVLTNVYQSKYENGRAGCSGLGDFIRGCYFILEICEKYHFQPKFIFNNYISKFLLIKTHNLDKFEPILKKIIVFRNNNFKKFVIKNGIVHEPLRNSDNIISDFVDYVLTSPQIFSNVFLFSNTFPSYEIPEKNKEYIRYILSPTNEMKQFVEQTLYELNMSSKKYNVIHIRSGDNYLKEQNHTFRTSYITDLIQNIKNDIGIDNGIGIDYLLLSDNNYIKNIIKQSFPTFKILIKPITHFGEGIVLEEEKVKNTLLDFYLLSHSNQIFSYSCYDHGSGFSYWCAKTFNIPYVCKFIQ